ncbi:MAG: hypothetical protein WBW85_08135, partial [Terriglobales bacterium]
ETATALVPRSGATRLESPAFAPRFASMTLAGVQVYELDYPDKSHGFFFRLGDASWSFGPWSSDARVLYCRIENEKLAHLVLIGGTYVAWQQKPLMKVVGPCSFFEWRKQDSVMNAAPGGVSVTPLFEELTSNHISNRSSHPSSNPSSSTYAEKR